jgi:hypothetical protein
MMRLKRGVDLRGSRPETLVGVMIAGEIWRSFGYDFTLTSVVDGKHSAGSLHPDGLAFDCRTRDIPPDKRTLIADQLRAALGPQFDVVLEKDHIHVEFQPK